MSWIAAGRVGSHLTRRATFSTASPYPPITRVSVHTSRTPALVSRAARLQARVFSSTALRRNVDEPRSFSDAHFGPKGSDADEKEGAHDVTEHAVISTFDLFSIGIGPSSSHTVGPLRAGNIFVSDLIDVGLLPQVHQVKIALYGSLAATGEGHMTPQALLAGLEGADCETIEPERVPVRFQEILDTQQLCLGKHLDGGGRDVIFDYKRDLVWHWGQTLPLHSNGMRMMAFDAEGNMLATNDFYSVGGGFVVNGALSTAASSGSKTDPKPDQVARATDIPAAHPADLGENLFYKEIRRSDGHQDRRSGFEPRVSEHVSNKAEIEAPALDSSSSPPVATVSSGPEPEIEKSKEKSSSPPYPFHDGQSLLALTKKHNMTIAQIVYENERHWYTDEEIQSKLFRIWEVMDECIRTGVHATETNLPGSLRLRRRAPGLYKRLMRGFYVEEVSSGTSPLSLPSSLAGPAIPALSGKAAETSGGALSRKDQKRELQLRAAASFRPSPPKVTGSFSHPILPVPPRKTVFPAMDFLSTYAIAVNEVNAAGGRIVTSPTNGAAGVIPAVLRYLLAFISEDPHRDICTFLLTASAIGMLFKRGATISAAEGGCMAEVGVACSMAAAAFAACMGASPHVVEQAAEIGIEHNLGLTCDPVEGLVQIPCIERNGMGAVKAVTAAQLALANADGEHAVTLDAAIHAMRMTARDMHTTYKETSLAGLARTVRVPVAVPDC
ncbi:hypothetical protein OC846_005331 [Tilletia horrida]|uniref:L-serine ammonia-lyase n=1 Tax=Tilletia horrida TaxID=155126 RepID=A0AAN6GL03_9BASI|nr:hypothetical protein OC846_005331 [Tilletia horrida]